MFVVFRGRNDEYNCLFNDIAIYLPLFCYSNIATFVNNYLHIRMWYRRNNILINFIVIENILNVDYLFPATYHASTTKRCCMTISYFIKVFEIWCYIGSYGHSLRPFLIFKVLSYTSKYLIAQGSTNTNEVR